MLIPSCNRCGQCGCVCGTLPYTMTVEFAGLVNKTHTRHCDLQFSSCFGSGASGIALSPGGTDPDDRGPLTSVLLLAQGCGYAVLGRQQPSVSITGSGTGATFTPSVSETDDACGRPVWQIASVAVSGGTGYTDGETLAVAVTGIVTAAPALTLRCVRAEPTLNADGSGGTGAVLSVTMTLNGTTPATWGVASVTVLEPGSGYGNGDSVTFSLATANDKQVAAATATITTEVGSSPDVGQIEIRGIRVGYGAEFDLSFVAGGGQWDLVVEVTNGGQEHVIGDFYNFVIETPTSFENALYEVTGVDGNGAITELTLVSTTGFAGGAGSGAIASVSVTSAGQYFRDSRVPSSVAVDNGGEFYAENPALPAIVADVTVTAPACGGTGEEIEATVDDDPASPTFSRITALSVVSGGQDHLAWEWQCTNHSVMNGEPIVLVAENPTKLVTLSVNAAFGSGACLRVVPVGDGTACDPPIAALYDGQPGPIREVEIVSGGSGYARIGREQPQWTVTEYGWTLTPSFGTPVNDSRGLPGWSVVSFAISGSGLDTIPNGHPVAVVLGANEYVEQHVVATVAVVDGVPTSVTVSSGGRYYRQNTAIAPLVSTPTVSIVQLPPSNGTGAAVSVTVDDDPQSDSFGAIVSASLTGGSGYTILGGPLDCSYAAFACQARVGSVELRGHGKAPFVRLTDTDFEAVFQADDVLDDCNSLPTSATLWYGAPSGSVTITRGGTVATECAFADFCPDGDCVCPPDESLCGEVPFTLVCDGNAGSCVDGGSNESGPYPPYWNALGSSDGPGFDGDDYIPARSNEAWLRCYNRHVEIDGECVFVKWAVEARQNIVCSPVSTDFYAIRRYYALIDVDEDCYPVAGVVSLIEGSLDGSPALEVGDSGDCGLDFIEPVSVEITRP